jgi:hypothetical protein
MQGHAEEMEPDVTLTPQPGTFAVHNHKAI